jgi:hypothetical protein
MQTGERSEQPPTIHVRVRRSPGLALLVGGALVLGIGFEGYLQGRFHHVFCFGLMGVGGMCVLIAVRWLFDRRPRVIINAQGVEVTACRTGLLRWSEIVHVECFSTAEQGGVALFVTAEALARIPSDATRNGTPVLANDAFAGPPIWFSDGMLEHSAADIAAELVARRRGDLGPITKRLCS